MRFYLFFFQRWNWYNWIVRRRKQTLGAQFISILSSSTVVWWFVVVWWPPDGQMNYCPNRKSHWQMRCIFFSIFIFYCQRRLCFCLQWYQRKDICSILIKVMYCEWETHRKKYSGPFMPPDNRFVLLRTLRAITIWCTTNWLGLNAEMLCISSQQANAVKIASCTACNSTLAAGAQQERTIILHANNNKSGNKWSTNWISKITSIADQRAALCHANTKNNSISNTYCNGHYHIAKRTY